MLRDGSFKQGKYKLKSFTESTVYWDAWGVLCEIHEKGGRCNYGWKTYADYDNSNIGWETYERSIAIPPDCVLDFIFPQNVSKLERNKVVNIICSMNDSGKTFKEIADWIENNL